jgi:hypothetical protein
MSLQHFNKTLPHNRNISGIGDWGLGILDFGFWILDFGLFYDYYLTHPPSDPPTLRPSYPYPLPIRIVN